MSDEEEEGHTVDVCDEGGEGGRTRLKSRQGGVE